MRAIMVDVETGGLDPRVHALTSVAAIAFEVDAQGAWVLDEISLPVRPSDDLGITRKALEVQGASHFGLFNPERLSESEALGRFTLWLDGMNTRLPFVAHNAAFDRGFFDAWLHRANHAVSNGPNQIMAYAGHRAPWICTINLANALIAAGRLEKPASLSLDALAAHLGVKGRESTKHDALDDCRVGVRVAGELWRKAGWV